MYIYKGSREVNFLKSELFGFKDYTKSHQKRIPTLGLLTSKNLGLFQYTTGYNVSFRTLSLGSRANQLSGIKKFKEPLKSLASN